MRRGNIGTVAVGVVVGAMVVASGGAVRGARPVYRSPLEVKFSPDGRSLAVSDHTGGALVLVDPAAGKVGREVPLRADPAGVAWSADGRLVYVAETGAGTVAEVDPAGGKVVRRLAVGPRPVGIALVPERGLLLAANSGDHTVSVVELESGAEKARIGGLHWPYFIAATPDGMSAVVAALLPATPSDDPGTSSAVSLLDLAAMKKAADLRLTPNSALVRQVATSPDGKWAYAVHTLGRTTLPTTQLERGWVNTNALTVIDVAKQEIVATVLLDQLSEGAADPWGCAVSPDGKTLWVTLAGPHQIGRLDVAALHRLLAGDIPKEGPEQELRSRGYPSIWFEIQKDPAKREVLSYDLAALYGAGIFDRIRIDGKGPRGIDVSPDGNRVAVAVYFAGEVLLTDSSGKPTRTISLGDQPAPDAVRRGEILFHDATMCFQHWLSCATCHPDGRADGLNWDLLNDGIGNPKNTRSLLWSHRTPPVMSLGVRETMETASDAGFRFILFRRPEPEDVEAVTAYLRAMAPEPSPYLENGKLAAKARQGKVVFEKAGCGRCHPAPLFTDLKAYDVGTRGELDRKDAFDTPTLVELWRTGPYLHHGGAVTLEEVFTKFNEGDRHGKTSDLSADELDALIAYLKSL